MDKGKVLESIAVGTRGELPSIVSASGGSTGSQSFIGEASGPQRARAPSGSCSSPVALVRQALNGALAQAGAGRPRAAVGLSTRAWGARAVRDRRPLLSRGRTAAGACAGSRTAAPRPRRARRGPQSLNSEHVRSRAFLRRLSGRGFLWADTNSERPSTRTSSARALSAPGRPDAQRASLAELSKVTIRTRSRASTTEPLQSSSGQTTGLLRANAAIVLWTSTGAAHQRDGEQAAGDRLSPSSAILRSGLRRIDFVARHGGDSCAALPHTEGARRADRLLRSSLHEFHLPKRSCPCASRGHLRRSRERGGRGHARPRGVRPARGARVGAGSIIRIGDPAHRPGVWFEEDYFLIARCT